MESEQGTRSCRGSRSVYSSAEVTTRSTTLPGVMININQRRRPCTNEQGDNLRT